MRVCQRCGAESTEARCPACGYTSFIELGPTTQRPATPPAPPTPPPATPAAPTTPEAPVSAGLELARRRGWWTLGLLLFPTVCKGIAELLTWLVPKEAAGCLPVTVTIVAMIFATVDYLSQVPLLLVGVVMGILALVAWRQAVRPAA